MCKDVIPTPYWILPRNMALSDRLRCGCYLELMRSVCQAWMLEEVGCSRPNAAISSLHLHESMRFRYGAIVAVDECCGFAVQADQYGLPRTKVIYLWINVISATIDTASRVIARPKANASCPFRETRPLLLIWWQCGRSEETKMFRTGSGC